MIVIHVADGSLCADGAFHGGQPDNGQSRRSGSLNRLPHKRAAETPTLVSDGDIDFRDIKSVLELPRRQESYRSAIAVIHDP